MLSVDFADLGQVLRGAGGAGASALDVEDDDGRESQQAAAPRVRRCPALEPGVTREQLVARMRVTLTEARAVETYEQGTEPWFLSRRGTQTRLPDGTLWSERPRAPNSEPLRFQPGRLTASNFGTAVGHNKYSKPDALVADMLWGTVVSNEAMRYGSAMEPVACDVFETAMFFLTGGATHVEHRGLMLACPGLQVEEAEGVLRSTDAGASQEPTFEGWCGTSPDGIVHDRSRPSEAPWLLEIKCPSVNKRTFYDERRGNEAFGIPHYYYDQIQGIMGLQRLPMAWFVVHLPERTQLALYRFDAGYYAELMAGMRAFWFDRYLPAALACAQGRLLVGGTEALEEEKQQEHEQEQEQEQEPPLAGLPELEADFEAEVTALISRDLEELDGSEAWAAAVRQLGSGMDEEEAEPAEP
jgi:hypothetical protein